MELSNSERKEKVNELLRKVDKEVKSGNFESAQKLIAEVYEIAETNIYAQAYSERIIELIKERPSSSAQNALQEPISANIVNPKHKLSVAVSNAYQSLLAEIWKDGLITDYEMERIDGMRTLFQISVEDHEAIELNVRHTAFIIAIKEEILSGKRDFEHYKQQYRISAMEFAKLQPSIKAVINFFNHDIFIYVIDDDKDFLLLIKVLLEKKGYNCITAKSVEEAYSMLEAISPDIILCDLKLGDSSTGGVLFYEYIRSLNKFNHVPFIFITGFATEEFVLKAKDIGVDDFFEKPINQEMLLASIEGKLRRIQEMRFQKYSSNQ